MSGQLPVVAVVDATGEGVVVVWWVNVAVALDLRMSRLCGAWVLDPDDTSTIDRVVAGRIGLLTGPGAAALRTAGLAVYPQLDLEATWRAAAAELTALQPAFDTQQAARPGGKRLTPPVWPILPELLDLDDPESPAGPPAPFRALGIARWLEQLCGRWGELEGTRLARPQLRDLGGPAPRPLPLALVAAS